jgi:hypothetical protein
MHEHCSVSCVSRTIVCVAYSTHCYRVSNKMPLERTQYLAWFLRHIGIEKHTFPTAWRDAIVSMQKNQSEIARLRAAIEAEYIAAQHALYSFTMKGRHEYITACQENIGRHFETLTTMMAPEEAIMIVASTLEQCGETGNSNLRAY